MALADLHSLDLVGLDPTGVPRWTIHASSGFPEGDDSLTIVQFLFKLAIYERHAAERGVTPVIDLLSVDQPPACVVEIMRRRKYSARVGTGEGTPATGRDSRFELQEDHWPDIDALQQANAAAFAHANGLPIPARVDALAELDAVIEARRREHGLGEDDTDDSFIDGDLMVLAGAYAGEAIRTDVGGDWRFDLHAKMVSPIYFAGSDGSMINLIGKVLKFLRGGASDSVASLVEVVVRRMREG